MLADWPLIARRLVRRLGGDADNGDGGLCVLALLHCCTMTNDDCARKEEEKRRSAANWRIRRQS